MKPNSENAAAAKSAEQAMRKIGEMMRKAHDVLDDGGLGGLGGLGGTGGPGGTGGRGGETHARHRRRRRHHH